MEDGGKHQPLKRDIDILTIKQEQYDDHRAARHREKSKITYTVVCGVTGLGLTGAMIYGLVDETTKTVPELAGAWGIGATFCYGLSLFFLYQVLKSKGFVLRKEDNLS